MYLYLKSILLKVYLPNNNTANDSIAINCVVCIFSSYQFYTQVFVML